MSSPFGHAGDEHGTCAARTITTAMGQTPRTASDRHAGGLADQQQMVRVLSFEEPLLDPTRLRNARLRQAADRRPRLPHPRGLDRAQPARRRTGSENTGAGKTWIACALGRRSSFRRPFWDRFDRVLTAPQRQDPRAPLHARGQPPNGRDWRICDRRSSSTVTEIAKNQLQVLTLELSPSGTKNLILNWPSEMPNRVEAGRERRICIACMVRTTSPPTRAQLEQ